MAPRKRQKVGPGPSDVAGASTIAMVGELQKSVAACVELVYLALIPSYSFNLKLGLLLCNPSKKQ